MKKFISFALIAAMAVTTLVGCGNKGAKADGGSSDAAITVMSREDGSGTRGAFIELFGIEEEENGEKVDKTTDEASITNSTSVMMSSVANDANAIGYISLGSLNDTVKAVKKLLGGMEINGYYELNMSEIPTLNQIVGGVTVTLEEDFTDKYPEMKKGATLQLTDDEAYAYVHDRYGVGDEENASRMKRQQQYMTGFFKKLQDKIKSNSNYTTEIFEQLQDKATTDITVGTISNISNIFASGTNKGIYELQGESKVGQSLGDDLDHMEFYVDKDSMVTTMEDLFGIKEHNNKE